MVGKEMNRNPHRHCNHRRTAVHTLHALRQRAGIPYEVERVVCLACGRVLEEHPLRRAAA